MAGQPKSKTRTSSGDNLRDLPSETAFIHSFIPEFDLFEDFLRNRPFGGPGNSEPIIVERINESRIRSVIVIGRSRMIAYWTPESIKVTIYPRHSDHFDDPRKAREYAKRNHEKILQTFLNQTITPKTS